MRWFLRWWAKEKKRGVMNVDRQTELSEETVRRVLMEVSFREQERSEYLVGLHFRFTRPDKEIAYRYSPRFRFSAGGGYQFRFRVEQDERDD